MTFLKNLRQNKSYRKKLVRDYKRVTFGGSTFLKTSNRLQRSVEFAKNPDMSNYEGARVLAKERAKPYSDWSKVRQAALVRTKGYEHHFDHLASVSERKPASVTQLKTKLEAGLISKKKATSKLARHVFWDKQLERTA